MLLILKGAKYFSTLYFITAVDIPHFVLRTTFLSEDANRVAIWD